MLILLRGGFHRNRGDEMMMHACADALRAHYPGVRVARPADSGAFEDRARMGFHQLLPDETSVAARLARRALRPHEEQLGIARAADVSAVFDVSGYFYTDEWNDPRVQTVTAQMGRWAARKVPVVLMPQSFGPFRTAASRELARRLADSCRIVFARDRMSLDHLREAVGADHPVVHEAPDFTGLVQARQVADFDTSRPYGCIVPNLRLTERKHLPPQQKQAYCAFLATAARQLADRGLDPVVVLHAPPQDAPLAQEIERLLGRSLRRADYRDPRELKGVLGGARVVVGSRFHALVGALTQAVPCIGLGWTHKFEMLFRQYECPQFLVNALLPERDLASLLDQVLQEPQRAATIAHLSRLADRHKQQTRQMWDLIFSAIDPHLAPVLSAA